MSKTPLLAAVLQSGKTGATIKDRKYALYSESYGIEMQFDKEWNAEVVLLTPQGLLDAITKGVTGPDTSIVTAGVTDVPVNWRGKPILTEIAGARNNWLLLAGPQSTDSDKRIKIKLRSAVEEGCRVILCFSEIGTSQLSSRLAGLDPHQLSSVVIAYTGDNATDPENAVRALQYLRESVGENDAPRFILGGPVTTKSHISLMTMEGMDGFLMLDDQYDDFSNILAVLQALDQASRVQ